MHMDGNDPYRESALTENKQTTEMRRWEWCHALKARKTFRSGCYYVGSQISPMLKQHMQFTSALRLTLVRWGFIYILVVGLQP